MTGIRCQLLKEYQEAPETLAFVTEADRVYADITEAHYPYACVMAAGKAAFKLKNNNVVYLKKDVAEGDYRRSESIRSEMTMPEKKICCFRKFNRAEYDNRQYFIKGCMSTGYDHFTDIHGNKTDFSHKPGACKTAKEYLQEALN